MDLIERAAKEAKEKALQRAKEKAKKEAEKLAGVALGSEEVGAAKGPDLSRFKSIGGKRKSAQATADDTNQDMGGTQSVSNKQEKAKLGAPVETPLVKGIKSLRKDRSKQKGESKAAVDKSGTAQSKPAAVSDAPKKKEDILTRRAKIDPTAFKAPVNTAPVEKVAPNKANANRTNVSEIDINLLRERGFITPDMTTNLMAEEFRIIKRTLLLNAFGQEGPQTDFGNVIMVTSSNPNEGKTFCSINLALSIATEQDTTVLLIDADFNKPEVLNRLGMRGGKGFMDVVADENLSIADCLLRTNVDNLVVMPAGRQHNRTTELLASERMKHIVTELSTRYPDRLIIFDAPPALASSVPSVLSLYAGQTVYVVAAEETSELMIKEGLTLINKCKNINLLLNKTRMGSSNKKFATYYGYGRR